MRDISYKNATVNSWDARGCAECVYQLGQNGDIGDESITIIQKTQQHNILEVQITGVK